MTDHKRHIHADLIIAWANGAKIQYRVVISSPWVDIANPVWDKNVEYRIKPEPKPDIVMYGCENNPLNDVWIADGNMPCILTYTKTKFDQVKYTFDGETGKLKSVEIVE